MEFGVSVLKGISGNKHTAHFVLYNHGGRVHLFHSIIDRLPTDVQRHFIIGKYMMSMEAPPQAPDEDETYPYISHSALGESTDSVVVAYFSLVVVYSSLVVVYSSLVVVYSSLVVVYSSLVCLQ